MVDCENHIQKEAGSPNGLWKALVFSRNCDATTPLNTQVSVLANAAALPDDGGNVYVSAQQALTVYWRPPHELHIVRDPSAKVYKSEGSSAAGRVVYEEKSHGAKAAPSKEQMLEPARTVAMAAADPYVKQEGFTIRKDYWGGDLPMKTSKAIVHQLFKGNAYWFWIGTDTPGARVSVHLYDSDGKLAETDDWQGTQCAGAAITPKRTGTYYLIVEVEASPEERTPWVLVYGFK